MKTNYDIAVIGGGPSGSAVSALLASEGFNVCLLEKKTFPREVLCGEFLSAEVISFIKNQGLFNKFIGLHPQKINSFRFVNDNEKELKTDFNFEAYALKRSAFDSILLEHAAEKGAVVICPGEVKNISGENGSFILTVKSASEEIDIQASKIIAAYGRQNILDKHLNRSAGKVLSGITGIKFHLNIKYFNTPPFNETQIYASDNIYCGINPVNDNDYTVCFLDNLKHTGTNPKDHIYYLLDKNKKFKSLFTENAEEQFSSIKIYGTGNLFFGEREKYKEGIYFIGDAAGIIAPLAGDGIGMALDSARMIADHLKAKDNPQDYINSWNKMFAKRLKVAKMVQNIIFNRFSRTPAINIASKMPSVLEYLVRKTRYIEEKL